MSIIRVVFLFLCIGSIISCKRHEVPGEKIRVTKKFTDGWMFKLGDFPGAENPQFDDAAWEKLNLPHDWSITEPYDKTNPGGHGTKFMIGGVGWYRKAFTLPEEYAGKRVEITFDGVYQLSTVWINGHKLGTRPFGYITFKYDLTPYLIAGDTNVIAVRVDNSDQPNSRWYTGSGIYRNVWLTKTDKLHIDPWGVFVTTPDVNEQVATVSIATAIRNDHVQDSEIVVKTEIFSPEGEIVGQTRSGIAVGAGGQAQLNQEILVDNPLLWSIETPALYTVRQTLLQGNDKIDDYQTTFGIRTFRFDPREGFFLNNEHVLIKGVCMHHDLGALGAAVNVRGKERQLEILREMGVNAIRTSHNPPAPEFLHLTDKMGFLVMNETFDEWKLPKVRYGYSVFWDEWHERDLRDHILRDRNHPSVIIWSIGNEILEQWQPQGAEMTTSLVNIVRELDPTRPVTAGKNFLSPENSLIKSGALDLIGINYNHNSWVNLPEMFPGKAFILTETTSALATRGSYDMPSDSIRRWPYRWDVTFTEGNPDNTCSAYDNMSTPWGSTHAETWELVRRHNFLSGMFVWTGFDYLGEPTPYEWPSRSSYFGIVDLAGFPKDAFYMYKSEWTTDTVLHIFPHWNWVPGKIVDVWAYYNHADEVELFLNNVSLGKRSKGEDDLHVKWRIPFEPGSLRAVSTRNGVKVKERIINTAGQPAAMQLSIDRQAIYSGGEDLSFITIRIVDPDGNLVPHASNLVKINIRGDATIAGVDNGSQTSHHNFQGSEIKAFNGKALAIVRGGTTPGTVLVTFESTGLPSQTIELVIKN